MTEVLSAELIKKVEQVIAGEGRLSIQDGITLYHRASTHQLGRWADAMCRRIHGDTLRTFVIDRNINYTNVCSARCTFCAFRRDEKDHDSYTLDRAALNEKIQELTDIGGTQILLQGGMHPDLPLEHYQNMLRAMKEDFPHIHIHGFSPPEFVEFVAVFEIPGFPTPGPKKASELPHEVFVAKLDKIIELLMESGLNSLPGGGGEIFPEHVRRRIGSTKATGQEWLDVMRAAHRKGMFTSATMMFGHVEGIADRFMHMNSIREAQEEAITKDWPGKYVSFISWPFQPDNTPLGKISHYDRESNEAFPGDVLADLVLSGEVDEFDVAACKKILPGSELQLRLAGATEYLRMQALSRLFMDNIHSIGSSWVTMGPKIGQIGLMFGANDMGSVMMEENVVSSAGTTYCLNEAMICRLIRDAGFTPSQRDNRYDILKIHDTEDAPDLTVENWAEYRPAGPGDSFFNKEEPVELTVSGD